MRHLSLIALLFSVMPAFGQDAKQQRINQAIDAAERICLVGNRYKFSADVSGSVTITKLLPGGNAKVALDRAEGKGSQFFDDQRVRELVDKDIRDCMKEQWPVVLRAIEASIPNTRAIEMCMSS